MDQRLPDASERQQIRVNLGTDRPPATSFVNGQIPFGADDPTKQGRPLKVYERYQQDKQAKEAERERWLNSDEYAQQQANQSGALRLWRESHYQLDLDQLKALNDQIKKLKERAEIDERQWSILKAECAVEYDDIFEIIERSQHIMALREAEPAIAEARARRKHRIEEWRRQAESITGAIGSDIRARFETFKEQRLQSLRSEIQGRAESVNLPLTETQICEQAKQAFDSKPISLPSEIDVAEWESVIAQIDALERPAGAEKSTPKKKHAPAIANSR